VDSYERMRFIHRLVKLTDEEVRWLEVQGVSKPSHLMLLDKDDIDSFLKNAGVTNVKRRSLAQIATFLARGGNLYRAITIADVVRSNARTDRQDPQEWARQHHQSSHENAE
jgi:hypothetical protein